MQKLPAVETAKTVMTEAVAWSVMKWLRQKKQVRKIADEANAALDELNHSVKERWPADAKAAYKTLIDHGARATKTSVPIELTGDPHVILNVKKVKAADEEAYRARMDAEATFDLAEKHLSTAIAREGCRKAIHSWELHEKAIRLAEGFIASHQQA